MALRVQGLASPGRLAAAVPDGSASLDDLVSGELCVERGGRGFSLTPKGLRALDELLAEEGLRGHPSLTECYERFLGLNKRVLRVSSDWQLRRDGGVEVPNDHSDPSYDGDVIERLAELHDRVRLCLEKIGGCAPRFAPYAARLDACVARLRAGDRTAFTAPLAESYHTVWFELHQDLLLTLGLEREE